MIQLWALKQQSLLLIFSWLRFRQQLLISTVQSRWYGKDISMTCFSYGTLIEEEIYNLTEHGTNYHLTIIFTADISDKEITFLDTCIYKGARFEKESILDTCNDFKPTETFQYTQFKCCHSPKVKLFTGDFHRKNKNIQTTPLSERLPKQTYR